MNPVGTSRRSGRSGETVARRAAYKATFPFLMLFPLAFFVGVVFGQNDPEDGRNLWDTRLSETSPKPSKRNREPYRRRAGPTTRMTSPPAKGGRVELLGVTVWRLRPTSEKDPDGPRELVEVDAESVEPVSMTPVRIGVDTPLEKSDLVRFGVEPTQRGFLYVVNREIYRDGSFGEPVLIFPTRRYLERFQTSPHVPIEFPDRFFAIRPKSLPDGRRYVGEQVILVVAREKLDWMMVDSRPRRIEPEEFQRFIRESVEGEAFDLVENEGAVYSSAEKEAARTGVKLREGAPLPRNVFRATVPEGKTLRVSFSLKVEDLP